MISSSRMGLPSSVTATAPARCSAANRGDGFFVALSGLAQVNVEIDEAGGDDQAAGVEFFVGAAANFIRWRNFGHAAVA
ncbi:MAG: hypothetical protein ABSC33_09685 [Candidatus Sulfotelmatobacter sp.]